jgi:hypothetical protein
MLFALLVLATPRIGPPPNVGPLKPEPELDPGLELEDADPGDFEFPSASEGLPEEELPGEELPEEELPEDELPEDESPELPLAPACVPELPVG